MSRPENRVSHVPDTEGDPPGHHRSSDGKHGVPAFIASFPILRPEQP